MFCGDSRRENVEGWGLFGGAGGRLLRTFKVRRSYDVEETRRRDLTSSIMTWLCKRCWYPRFWLLHPLYTVPPNGPRPTTAPASRQPYPSTRAPPTAPVCPVRTRLALFLPHDARYGCLNSRGEALGARFDLISSETPVLELLQSIYCIISSASPLRLPSFGPFTALPKPLGLQR